MNSAASPNPSTQSSLLAPSVASTQSSLLAPSASTFEWRNIFLCEPGEISWQHSGIDVLPDGRLIYAAPDGSTLVIEDVAARTREFVETPVHEMHDVVSAEEGIWLCDIGHKYVLSDGAYVDKFTPARVVRINLLGEVLQELLQPDLPDYKEKTWSPTGLTVAPNGDVWIADGYSSYLVLRFNSHGEFLQSFNGEKAALDFNCPHTIRCIVGEELNQRSSNGANTMSGENQLSKTIASDSNDPHDELTVPDYELAVADYELVIADRANKRLVWMRADGEVTRIEDDPLLTSPSGITRYGAGLLVTQLHGSLVYVGDDGHCRVILSGPDNHLEAGWPNSIDGAGVPVAPALSTSSLISPHGITTSKSGEVFLTQWLIGGHVLGGTPR